VCHYQHSPIMNNQEELLKKLVANSQRTIATLQVLTGIVAQMYAKDKQLEDGIIKSHEVYFLEIQNLIDQREKITFPEAL